MTNCCKTARRTVPRRLGARPCSSSACVTWQLHLTLGAAGTSARPTWQLCLLSYRARAISRYDSCTLGNTLRMCCPLHELLPQPTRQCLKHWACRGFMQMMHLVWSAWHSFVPQAQVKRQAKGRAAAHWQRRAAILTFAWWHDYATVMSTRRQQLADALLRWNTRRLWLALEGWRAVTRHRLRRQQQLEEVRWCYAQLTSYHCMSIDSHNRWTI